MSEQVIRNRDDLIEALRSRKELLGLSNAFVEDQLQMADGHCDKLLGPTQRKGMSIPVLLDMVELFGGRLVFSGRCRDRSADAGALGATRRGKSPPSAASV